MTTTKTAKQVKPGDRIHRKRTDVHSPLNVITEDYEFVGCGEFCDPNDPDEFHYTPQLPEGWRFGQNHSAGDCYHCGAHLRYYAVLKHEPTHTLVRVGETCLDNRFSLATAEFQRLRKAASLRRAEHRIVKARERWASEHEAEFTFLDEWQQGERYNNFYDSLWRSLKTYGELSERQLAALQRSIEQRKQWDAEDAQRKSEEPEQSPVPESDSRMTVTGRVVSVKWQQSIYGETLKMLVLDDRGFKVWGTVPSAIVDEQGENWNSEVKGTRMTFTAKVTKSEDDPCFGFFSRPTKAVHLADSE